MHGHALGELVKLHDWVQHTRKKVVILFKGRAAAGKGGVIKRITQRLNPRVVRVAALPAPNEPERTQWYFQRVHIGSKEVPRPRRPCWSAPTSAKRPGG